QSATRLRRFGPEEIVDPERAMCTIPTLSSRMSLESAACDREPDSLGLTRRSQIPALCSQPVFQKIAFCRREEKYHAQPPLLQATDLRWSIYSCRLEM